MFEPYALIVSLVSLGVSWRAYLLSKRAHEIQSEAHGLQKSDLEARHEPKVQVTNETFLSSWQIENTVPHCKPEELELRYSSIVKNKGETVALLESVTIEVGPAESPLAEPKYGLGCLVSGAMYLAAGESISLGTTITADTISMIRLFFEQPEGVLVFTLVFKFRGYAGPPRTRRTEIYRLNHKGGIISKGSYNAAGGIPRAYLLTDA
ncbi:MAG: hypothetical protein OEL88_08680 [Sterolibacteriaceae bacterium MAG5]|nr:hypothetical protein [Candidatus Nitricoxidireducens bremensis]